MSDDDRMPPRPSCDFDFNLPHGIENVDVDQHSPQGPDGTMEEASIGPESSNDLFDDDQQDSQTMNYDTFGPGFSDDEGGKEAFDRSWKGQQARKPSPKKKSPRRTEDSDGDDEASPLSKKPRQSLFGGAVEDVEEKVAPKTPEHGIRNRMSSMNLDEQDIQDDLTSSFGVGLGPSNWDSRSPIASRAASEESIVIPPDDQPAYELRKNIDRSKTFTYIDQDKTGNYDPSEEAKQKITRLQKAKAAKAAKKKGKMKERPRKEHIMKCIVQLRFDAFGNVRNATNDEDNWPDDWSDIDSECERKRQAYRDYHRRGTPDVEQQVPISYPGCDMDDLTGHPAARGCQHCYEAEIECTMVEGGTYPCEECESEDHLCKPIFRPTIKGSCVQCAEDDEDCSFGSDPENPICIQCAEGEFACEALPRQGYTHPRDSMDVIAYGPDRKHAPCTFCRGEKKRCSLKKKSDRPPCKYCKKHGIGCTFYALPKFVKMPAKGKEKAVPGPTEGDAPEVSKPGSEFFSLEDFADMDARDEVEMSREATPELEMEDEAGNKGMLTKIKTSFAHPISFSATVDQPSDCNFCEMPMFGFVGHWECEVHVIRWHNNLGYTELGGGHCEHTGPTRMCNACTTGRLQVIVCPGHDFMSMREGDEEMVMDVNRMTDELISAEPGSQEMRYELQRWCSFCCSIATLGCGTRQPSVAEREDGMEMEVVGCGLRLCDTCAERLNDEFAGDVGSMAEQMDGLPKTGEADGETGDVHGKVRADVGFLSVSGLLMRCMDNSE